MKKVLGEIVELRDNTDIALDEYKARSKQKEIALTRFRDPILL
jgi:hypothetical protein